MSDLLVRSNFGPYRLKLAVALVALVCGGCASGSGTTSKIAIPDATAQLTDGSGADRGRVDVFRDGDGLRLEIVARGFNPGSYGMHIHAIGRCDPPAFSSAGPHWNPTGAQHGADNPQGAHRGDLPNLQIEPQLIGRATAFVRGAALAGEAGLLDADGAAFVIHARPDDLKSDPTGNSGDRLVCGVFAAR